MNLIRTSALEPIVPPDGSEVREIARPPDTARNQSLAEARLPPGGETAEHFHRTSEEIYHFVSGVGRVRVDDEESEVGPGETVVIPGTRHKLWNPGGETLVLLCCSSPPYYDEDTVLTE